MSLGGKRVPSGQAPQSRKDGIASLLLVARNDKGEVFSAFALGMQILLFPWGYSQLKRILPSQIPMTGLETAFSAISGAGGSKSELLSPSRTMKVTFPLLRGMIFKRRTGAC